MLSHTVEAVCLPDTPLSIHRLIINKEHLVDLRIIFSRLLNPPDLTPFKTGGPLYSEIKYPLFSRENPILSLELLRFLATWLAPSCLHQLRLSPTFALWVSSGTPILGRWIS